MLPQLEYTLHESLTAAVQSRKKIAEKIAMLQQAIAAAEAAKEPTMDACPQMANAKQMLELLQQLQADLEASLAQPADVQKPNAHPTHR
jgi:hypothetical protein